MMNFKNSKTAKVVSGFVGLATAVMMMGPAIASAATVEELTAQINVLNAQIAAQSSSQTTTTTNTNTSGSGYQFTADLTIGSKGQSVTELQMILVAKGFLTMPAGVAMGYFGNLTKSAVSAWQASAGISPTAGYVGPKSRAALNGMSGSSSSSSTTTTTTSGMVPGCSSTSGFSVISGASCATGAVISTVAGCTSTTGFSPTTGQACSAGTTSVVPAGSGVTVALDATSPMSSTLISGQAVATLAVFRIMNGGTTEAKVTQVKLKRTGVSSDTTLSNIYLYNGAARITDAAAVASGVVNFNDSTGLVKIPAGGSVSLAVRTDLAASTNGQTIGMMLTDVMADGVAATGVPVSGSEHTIAAAPSGMTTVDFTTAAATPAVNTALDPQSDLTMWNENVSIGNRDALLKSFRLRQIGSVNTSDLKNFRLMIDGIAVGSPIEMLDSNGYVTWSFATPVTLKSGTRVFKLVGDIVGGSNKNFQFSLRQAGDAEIADSQLGVTVLPTAAAAAFAAVTTGLQTISAGTLTITKATDSLSGNVVLSGSGVTLAKFNVKAQGEKLKVENLRVSHTASTDLWTGIRNGALFLNGVQVGSTATINEDTVATPYTQFNLGSSMVLEPGTAYVLEVRGDVYNTNTTSGTTLIAGTTTVINIPVQTSNVQRMTSLSYIGNSVVSGNTLTVAAGTLALAKYGAYASQTVTAPKTAYKLAEYRLTTGATEAVNVDTFSLAHTGTITDLTNLYIVYGSKTSSIKTSSSSPISWSVNEAISANTNMTIAVYGNIGSGLTSGTFTGTLTVSGTSQNSGSAVTSSAVAGQAVTLGAGSISVALDASTPVASLAVAGTMPKVGSFKFTTSNDMFTIDELTVRMASGTVADAAAISELVFKDGATELKRQPMNGVNATATGLSIAIAANTDKVIDVYAQLGNIGTGFAASNANIGLALESYEFLNSAGVKTRTFGTATSSNNMYVYRSKPTITNVAFSTVLSGGTQTLYKFQVAADAAGSVAWQKINFTVATSGAGSIPSLTGWALYDVADESTALSGVTVTQNAAGTVVTASSTVGVDQQIGAGAAKTYVLKATVNGTLVTGYSVSTKIASGGAPNQVPTSAATAAAATTNFVWSDLSVTPHSAVTSDWFNDYLVKNLPTDSMTVTK